MKVTEENKHIMGSKLRPGNVLQRKDFIEVILRILPFEFPKMTVPEGVERFLKEHVNVNIPKDHGSVFRLNEIWTRDVSELLKSNRSLLRQVLKKYEWQEHGTISYTNLVRMLMQDTASPIITKKEDLIKAIAFSKW